MRVQEFAPLFREAVHQSEHILVISHLNPDGDALGSTLAVGALLDQMGASYEMLNHSPAPYNIQFLPGSQSVLLEPSTKPFDTLVILDLNSVERMGRHKDLVPQAKKVIVIDHHVAHEKPGDLRFVDPTAPATAMLVYELARELNLDITPDIANCLLTGIVTDTGSFRYRNTTPASLHAAAQLVEFGADISHVSQEVYMQRPLASVLLVGRALDKMKLSHQNQLAWGVLKEQDFIECGAKEEHTEGLTSEMLTLQTVQIAALLRQPPGGKVRASFRSREPYDVSQVARVFGGGGHKNASGCTFDIDIETAEKRVVEELQKCLES